MRLKSEKLGSPDLHFTSSVSDQKDRVWIFLLKLLLWLYGMYIFWLSGLCESWLIVDPRGKETYIHVQNNWLSLAFPYRSYNKQNVKILLPLMHFGDRCISRNNNFSLYVCWSTCWIENVVQEQLGNSWQRSLPVFELVLSMYRRNYWSHTYTPWDWSC